MGCDIHMHIEVKINGNWEHYAFPHISRRYRLFGKMAGVRDTSQDPISPPKGIPEDITTVTRVDLERYGNDGHHHSWFSYEEIVALDAWLAEQPKLRESALENDLECDILNWTFLFGNSFSGLKKSPQDFPKSVTDVRMVFWFNN